MMQYQPRLQARAQAGFTLIELVVVIVILGILAATALPRMFDMSGQARFAKMQAALGALKAASNSGHAQWLATGGLFQCTDCAIGPAAQASSLIAAEGTTIITVGGYPDVGGDGITNAAVAAGAAAATTAGAASGIVKASGLTAGDYVMSATATAVTVSADAAHPSCNIIFTEATQGAGTTGTATAPGTQPTTTAAPVFTTTATVANCS